MPKTSKDEEYEREVSRGQRGSAFDDFMEHTIKPGPSSPGYKYGESHRRDKYGRRYHAHDSSGINDQKPTKKSKSSSSFDPYFKGDSRREDRRWDKSYRTEGDSGGGSIIGGSGGGIIAAVFLGIISLAIWKGYNKFNEWPENQNPRQRTRQVQKVVKSRSLQEIVVVEGDTFPKRNLAELQNWGVGLIAVKKVRNRNYGEIILRETIRTKSDFEEVRSGLINLGEKIRRKGGSPAINNYARVEDNVWAIGRYTRDDKGGGFICYSPNKGETWFSQWVSRPEHLGGDPYDIPFDIKFINKREGFAVTKRRIIQTSNGSKVGGKIWRDAFYSPMGYLGSSCALTENKLIIEDKKYLDSYFLTNYMHGKWPNIKKEDLFKNSFLVSSDGGRKWDKIPKEHPLFPEIKEEVEMKRTSEVEK